MWRQGAKAINMLNIENCCIKTYPAKKKYQNLLD